jgi:hypothetical protein
MGFQAFPLNAIRVKFAFVEGIAVAVLAMFRQNALNT